MSNSWLLGVASSDCIEAFDAHGSGASLIWRSATLPHCGQGLYDFSWISGGIFISCGGDGTVNMLHTQLADKNVDFPLPSKSRSAKFTCLNPGPERKDVLTGLSDGTVLLWNTKLARPVSSVSLPLCSAVSAIHWSGHDSIDILAAGSIDGRVSFFRDLQPVPSKLPLAVAAVSRLRFGSNGVLAIGDLAGTFRLFDTESEATLAKVGLSGAICGVEFFADQQAMLVASTSGELVIWDPRSSSVAVKSKLTALSSLALTGDGSLAALGHEEGGASLLDIRVDLSSPVVTTESTGRNPIVNIWSRPLSSNHRRVQTPVSDRFETLLSSLGNVSPVKSPTRLSTRSPMRSIELSSIKIPQQHASVQAENSFCLNIMTETAQPPFPAAKTSEDAETQTPVKEEQEDTLTIDDSRNTQYIDLVSRITSLEMQLSTMSKDLKTIVSFLKASS